MKKLLPILLCAVEVNVLAFEKIALVDSYDFTGKVDAETIAGTRQIVDHVLLTGADTVLWRHQSGSMPRYHSKEDDLTRMAFPLDQRRVGYCGKYGGWARLEKGETDLVKCAFDYCASKGVAKGVHYTFEEDHWCNWTFSNWNLEHPQFWCRSKGGTPWAGRCSLSYDEVLDHKLRIVDELIEMGAETFYLDLYRCGAWNIGLEYVPKMCEEFRRCYGEDPPDDPRDGRWIALFSRYMHRYVKGIRARCDASGRKIRFMLGLVNVEPGETYQWEKFGLDWRALSREGVFDGIVVSGVKFGRGDVWDMTRQAYEYVRENCGKADFYAHCSVYGYQNGIPQYARASGLSYPEVAQKLLDLAKECCAKGVVLECVDWGNYTPEINNVLKKYK